MTMKINKNYVENSKYLFLGNEILSKTYDFKIILLSSEKKKNCDECIFTFFKLILNLNNCPKYL